jgi:STE24 endopeptidase
VSTLDRRGAALLALGATVLLVVLAWALVPWDWTPDGSLRPVSPEEVLTPDEIARAESYAGYVRPLSWASYAISLGLALLLGLTALGSRLTAPVARRFPWWVTGPMVALGLLVAGRVVTLPFAALIRMRNLEEGLTTQSWAAWWEDRGLSLLVSWALVGTVVLVVLGTARRSPRHWHAWASGVLVALVFLGSLVYPLAVEPLFNRFSPLPPGSFKESVLELAEREGVRVDDVLVSDASRRTTTLNAYVSGLGGTRRVVVYDTLLEATSPAEARSVIAHELAHAKHRDVLVGTGLGALGAVAGVCLLALALDSRRLRGRVGITGPADPRAVALILALFAGAGLLASPVQNVMSRAVEARADRAALAATSDADAFRDVQRRLAQRSLADPTPPRWSYLWFASHPTVVQRFGLATWYEEAGR